MAQSGKEIRVTTYDIADLRNRNRLNIERKGPEMNTNNIVPLVTVAAELGADIDELAARLGDAVVVDPLTELRSITAEQCRLAITAHRATLAAERERRQRRLAEQRARPRTPVRKGIPATPNSTALADMIGADRR